MRGRSAWVLGLMAVLGGGGLALLESRPSEPAQPAIQHAVPTTEEPGPLVTLRGSGEPNDPALDNGGLTDEIGVRDQERVPITGEVVDLANRPISDLVLRVDELGNSGEYSRSVTTDQQGQFGLDGLIDTRLQFRCDTTGVKLVDKHALGIVVAPITSPDQHVRLTAFRVRELELRLLDRESRLPVSFGASIRVLDPPSALPRSQVTLFLRGAPSVTLGWPSSVPWPQVEVRAQTYERQRFAIEPKEGEAGALSKVLELTPSAGEFGVIEVQFGIPLYSLFNGSLIELVPSLEGGPGTFSRRMPVETGDRTLLTRVPFGVYDLVYAGEKIARAVDVGEAGPARVVADLSGFVDVTLQLASDEDLRGTWNVNAQGPGIKGMVFFTHTEEDPSVEFPLGLLREGTYTVRVVHGPTQRESVTLLDVKLGSPTQSYTAPFP